MNVRRGLEQASSLLGEVYPSKILHAARPGSQENPNRMAWDLTLTIAYLAYEIASGSLPFACITL